MAVSIFGKDVFIRGLIEVSNFCKNNCLYCGIRAANKEIERYRLSKSEILDCCRHGYELGFRTFVLQGGEDPVLTDDLMDDIISTIRSEFPDCAITLSLGERSAASYNRFKASGADRYLLRHETFNQEHYSKLHPAGMSRNKRQRPKRRIKACGLPQRLQRLYPRTVYFGVRLHFSIILLLAMVLPYLRKGSPSSSRRARPSSSVLAEVTKEMSIPNVREILSISISTKIVCSLMPKVKLPIPSKPRRARPRKSRTRGRSMLMKRNRNLKMP